MYPAPYGWYNKNVITPIIFITKLRIYLQIYLNNTVYKCNGIVPTLLKSFTSKSQFNPWNNFTFLNFLSSHILNSGWAESDWTTFPCRQIKSQEFPAMVPGWSTISCSFWSCAMAETLVFLSRLSEALSGSRETQHTDTALLFLSVCKEAASHKTMHPKDF